MDRLCQEPDLELRADLLEMETQQVEAAVATTISRGETLLLLIHRQSREQAQDIQDRLDSLRREWVNLKQKAELQKAEAKVAEKEVERFTGICSSLLVWLTETEK